MLSSSLRRAAWTPIVPITGIARAASSAGGAASTAGNPTTQHQQQHQHQQYVRQRRYSSSSSKPSDDGSSGLEASSQTPAKGVNSSGENKRDGKSKRRGKDRSAQQQQQQHSAFSKLPSVPSTQYQQPHGEFGSGLLWWCYLSVKRKFLTTRLRRCPRCVVLLDSPTDLCFHYRSSNLELGGVRCHLFLEEKSQG